MLSHEYLTTMNDMSKIFITLRSVISYVHIYNYKYICIFIAIAKYF